MMRRSKVILAVAMLLVSMLAASAAPAMADGNDNNRDTRLDRQDLRADRQLLHQHNNNGFECCEEDNFGLLFPFFGFDLDNEEDNDVDINTFDVGANNCFTADDHVFCFINGSGFPVRVD